MIDIGNRKMCEGARGWLEQQPNLYHAWRTCPIASWLVWWIGNASRYQGKAWDRASYAWHELDDPRAVRHVVTYREALALWNAQEGQS